jgi:transposase
VPSTSVSHYPFTHLGLDVHRDSISVAVLPPGSDGGEVDKIFNDGDSVRRLIGRLGDPGQLRACYEAGPTGYGLRRQLESMGVRCDVIAPALIPRVAGDRVKTDKRDARRLARLHRMGELVAIRVPTEAEEGVRDLLRAREDLLIDRRRARQRLSAMLLRHGQVFRDGDPWTNKHLQWLTSRRFENRAVQATYDHYRAIESVRDADMAAIEADLDPWFDNEVFYDRCSRLAAYRGIDRLGALTLVAEVCDWHRFASAHHH